MRRLSILLIGFLVFTGVRIARTRTVLDPKKIICPGKIWLSGTTLFVNDRFRGVHIFDISNPASPVRLSTIEISGNLDIAVKDNALYADSGGNLLVYDIGQIAKPRLVRTIPDACTYSWYYGEDDYGMGCEGCYATGDDASAGSSGGGSMARFAIVGDHLYSLRNYNIKIFSVTVATNPDGVGDTAMAWDIETIHPVEDRDLFFLGGRTGIYAYSITNRAWPVQISSLTHARSYDPVVVQGDFAYVTLRDGFFDDGGPSSRFEVVDISDLTNMRVVKTIGMDAPYGLAVQSNHAYVCDGYDGLEVFDISNPTNTSKETRLQGFNGYDVIVSGNLLILTGNDAVALYDLTNPVNPTLLSTL